MSGAIIRSSLATSPWARIALTLLLSCAGFSHAAEQRFALYLDTDANTATGCTLPAPNGAVAGVEQVLTTVVTTSAGGAVVSRIERQVCAGGALGAATTLNPGSWSAGIGNGSNGTAALETAIALNLLPASGTLRVTPVSTNATGGQDQTAAFAIPLGAAPPPDPGAIVPAPLSPLLLLVLVAGLVGVARWWQRRHPRALRAISALCLIVVAAGAWAIGGVVLDGNIGDWAGVSAAVTSPQSGPVDADMLAVYWQKDASTLYLRIDADVRPDAQSAGVAVNAGPDQTITLPAQASLAGSATLNGAAAAFTYQWQYQSGAAAAVTFADATQASTTATFDQPGDYVLRLSATSGAQSNYADVTVHVGDTGPTLSAIADRQLALGSTLSLVLAGSSPSVTQTLTYTLAQAPQGGSLAPTPRIVWTPSTAQLGANTFTATVTDSLGRSDSKTFTVTVVRSDRAPVLDDQPDATLARGQTFTRTLHASDPDGDVLAFAMSDAPAGMTLAGASLQWSTTNATPGTYHVTVQATDPSGLADAKRFAIVVTDAAAPVAQDDSYQVKVGQVLSVAAPGVLGNDVDPMGGVLGATRLSDPDKGTLATFNADGRFVYAAPARIGPPAFQPAVKWLNQAQNWQLGGNLRVVRITDPASLTGAKVTSVVALYSNDGDPGFSVFRGGDGSVVWQMSQFLPAPHDDCKLRADQSTDAVAVGDIDDSGAPAIVAPVDCVAADGDGNISRMVALDAASGAIKWISGRIGSNYADGSAQSSLFGVTPVIARLHAGESPSVLLKRAGGGSLNRDSDNTEFCKQYDPATTLTLCTGVIGLDGADGSVRGHWVAQADVAQVQNVGGGGRDAYAHLVVAPIPGFCSPCLIANGAVWDADGNVVSNWSDGSGVISTALARLDDGSTAIVSYESRGGTAFLIARRADASVIWRSATGGSNEDGQLSIGDIDGDGRADIVVTDNGSVRAFNAHGEVIWIRTLLDGSGNSLVHDGNRPAIFDLDGDGEAEVMVETSQGLLFLHGKDGSTKFQFDFTAMGANVSGSGASVLAPIVADIDASGHASVLVGFSSAGYQGYAGVIAIDGLANDWRDARPVYGQYSYHVADIADDGSVPAFPLVDAFATPRTNVFGNQPQVAAPVDPRAAMHTSFTYQATSATGLASAPVTVGIDILPQNTPPAFTTTPPTRFVYNDYLGDLYHPNAVDPDVGDTVTYSIVFTEGGMAGCSIDPATGAFAQTGACQLTGSDNGVVQVVIAATDSQGARTLQTIKLTQSSGSGSVPDVSGMTQAQASDTLAAATFGIGAISQIHAPATEGTVLSQYPAAGGDAAYYSSIDIVLSLGPAPVPVPFVVGMAIAPATTQLHAAGFTVAPTFAYSNTVAAGQVIAQTPAAGTLLSPAPAHPVGVVVSLGSGLELQLDRSIATAGQAIRINVLAFDLNDQLTAAPALTYTVTPVPADYSGALPTVSAGTIATGSDTRGSFVVAAVDVANGRVATAHFVIVPPLAAGAASSNGSAFANLAATLDAMSALREPLRAARAANDTAQMTALLQQMVTTWRTLDLEDLRLSVPLVTEQQFAPTEDMMQAFGESPAPDDLVVSGVLDDAVTDLKAFTTGLQTNGTSVASLNAMADTLNTRAARLHTLTVTRYGGVMNSGRYTKLMGHTLPAFYDALMEQIAATTGLPPRSQGRATQRGVARHRGNAPQSTLAEMLVTQAVDMVVDKIMQAGSDTYANAKQLATDVMQQAAWSAVAIALAHEWKATVGGGDIYEVASGASLSFREFNSPWSFIEVPGGMSDPDLVDVALIGPDQANAAGAAVLDLYNKMKKGFGVGVEGENPDAYENLDQIKADIKAMKDKLASIADDSWQGPDDVVRSCIFTSDPSCSQLTYDDGFEPVYTYSPPAGYGALGGIPVPIIFVVYNLDPHAKSVQTAFFGTPAFLPWPKP